MNTLKILKIKFTTKCIKDSVIHKHMGNTLRGAFGNTLQQLYKSKKINKDIYNFIFKNQTENIYADSLVYGKTNPFIIQSAFRNSTTIKKNDLFVFSFTLFGSACDYAKDVLEAIRIMMMGNIANNFGCFILERAEDFYTNNVYYSNDEIVQDFEPWIWNDETNIKKHVDTIKITLLEPAVLKHNGKLLTDIPFDIFFQAIIRRLTLLCSAYEENQFLIDSSFIEDSKKIKLTKSSLKLSGYNSYSSSTENNYPRKGVLGVIQYQGELNKFLPYINIGSVIHIGKGTTVGMGNYGWNIIK